MRMTGKKNLQLQSRNERERVQWKEEKVYGERGQRERGREFRIERERKGERENEGEKRRGTVRRN